MITHPTGRTAAAHKPLHAATKGERGKQAGYDAHKARCRALGSTDPGLDVPLVPLLFETYGAAGKNMQDFLRGMVRSYSTQILSLEDESATAYFRTYWSYRLSVAVACGTAAIVHHVPRGESVPARFRRPTKEDQYRLSTQGKRPSRGRPRGLPNLPAAPSSSPSHSSPSPSTPLNQPGSPCSPSPILCSSRCM